jgi:hypothetical protein
LVFTVIKFVPILSVDSLICVIDADPNTVKFCVIVKLPEIVPVLPEKLKSDDAVAAFVVPSDNNTLP